VVKIAAKDSLVITFWVGYTYRADCKIKVRNCESHMTFLTSFVIIGVLSRPLLRLLFGDIGFVYGGNRSFASYTKTKTVESAV
jgi:hypothetical protein